MVVVAALLVSGCGQGEPPEATVGAPAARRRCRHVGMLCSEGGYAFEVAVLVTQAAHIQMYNRLMNLKTTV